MCLAVTLTSLFPVLYAMELWPHGLSEQLETVMILAALISPSAVIEATLRCSKTANDDLAPTL